MASDPAYAATPNVGSALVDGTLDTSLTAPTHAVTILTAGASGSKIEEILMQGVGTTAAGVVNVFRYDGVTYHLIDQFLASAVTPSATVLAWQARRAYANLILKSGDSLRFTQEVAGNVSLIKATAFGADF